MIWRMGRLVTSRSPGFGCEYSVDTVYLSSFQDFVQQGFHCRYCVSVFRNGCDEGCDVLRTISRSI